MVRCSADATFSRCLPRRCANSGALIVFVGMEKVLLLRQGAEVFAAVQNTAGQDILVVASGTNTRNRTAQ